MSQTNIDAFLDRLSQEDAFRREVGEALQGSGDTGTSVVQIARDAGFEFSAEEFDQALDKRYAGRELNDAELDQVSGGGVTVGINSLSVVHSTSSGMTIAFPDVCKTLSPGGPIPIPYPNIGMSSDTTKGTKTTKPTG